ncbi:MAG: GNAT family N-acetyltransferase [Mycobacteriales bacterium]
MTLVDDAQNPAGADEVPTPLVEHLRGWVGGWPPATPPRLVGNPRRAAPGWDGRVHPVVGVVDPSGNAVIGVPPAALDRLVPSGSGSSMDAAVAAIERHWGGRVYLATFRWSTRPADLPDAGVWRDADDPSLPEWLRPFGGKVLVALDDRGGYLAGVGIKRHDRHGHELAVGTAEAARGRGLARRLVAQAARAVLADGAVPTYLHDPANTPSARVATAAGFPDLGWKVLGIAPQPS